MQATATERRQAAEAALMRSRRSDRRERNRTKSLTHELDTARREHNAAEDNVVRVSTAEGEDVEQERDRANGLARELIAARDQINILTASKARDSESANRRATASVPVRARPARKSGSQEIRNVELRKPSLPVSLTPISLPGSRTAAGSVARLRTGVDESRSDVLSWGWAKWSQRSLFPASQFGLSGKEVETALWRAPHWLAPQIRISPLLRGVWELAHRCWVPCHSYLPAPAL